MFGTTPKERRLALVTIVLACAVAFALGEITLRLFFEPYRVGTIGHPDADNAAIYGWGFYPGERFVLSDPDSGEVYPSHVNSRGWRDEEHTFENPDGAFRILVLGDSNTFGPTVPQDKTYPRILQDRLRAEGFNAEVISLSYGAWGTDQKLEALQNEGLKYAPDLIVLQYTANDVKFNVEHDPESLGAQKPFFYRLDGDGRLVREDNARPGTDGLLTHSVLKRLKRLLMHSEVLARLYGFYAMVKHVYTPERDRYVAGEGPIRRVRRVLELDDGHPLLRYLEAHRGESLPADEFAAAIRSAGLATDTDLIMRICENRWFNHGTEATSPDVAAPDPSGEDWRLFFALITEIRDRTRAAGADLALFADIDETGFDWAVYWGLSRDTAANRQNYLAPRAAVEAFARTRDIAVVPNVVPHVRSRNDPHQNVAGTTAMAENIYRFLLANYAERLRGRAPLAADD